MLISKKTILNILLIIIITSLFVFPLFSFAEVTLTTEDLKSTSVVLKAVNLPPNKQVTFYVDITNNLTPPYYKQQNATSNATGVATSYFTNLSPGGSYLGMVAGWEPIGSVAVNFTTPEGITNQSSAKLITSFNFSTLSPAITGVINNLSISLTVPIGTNVTALVPTIAISNKATISPTSGVVQDFTNPVIYTVTAEDGSTQAYTATVFLKVSGGNGGNTGQSTNTKTNYKLLEPLPDGSGGEFKDFESDPQCTTDASGVTTCTNPCPLGNYLNIMFKIFLGVAGVLAVIMIVMGGIQYMTSDLISSKEEGKKTILNAVFGLLIGLGAVLILQTINPDLLNVCLNTLPKAEITISPDYTPQTPVNGKYCTNTTGTNGGYSSGADWATIAGPIESLPGGIITNHPNQDCTTVGQPNCTSLRGLNMGIISSIKTKCPNCDIIVTAGTECWLHGGKSQSTTHRPGSPSVDIRATPSVNTFFTGNSSFPNDNQPYNHGGVSCKAEPNGSNSSTTAAHWHCEA